MWPSPPNGACATSQPYTSIDRRWAPNGKKQLLCRDERNWVSTMKREETTRCVSFVWVDCSWKNEIESYNLYLLFGVVHQTRSNRTNNQTTRQTQFMSTTNLRVQLCTINASSSTIAMLQLTLLCRELDAHTGGSGGYRSDQGVQAPANVPLVAPPSRPKSDVWKYGVKLIETISSGKM